MAVASLEIDNSSQGTAQLCRKKIKCHSKLFFSFFYFTFSCHTYQCENNFQTINIAVGNFPLKCIRFFSRTRLSKRNKKKNREKFLAC